MRNLVRKGFKFTTIKYKNNSKFNVLAQGYQYEQSNKKRQARNWNFSMMLGALFSTLLINKKSKCEDNKLESQPQKEAVNIDIYELNKSQFLQLLANINEEGILLVFNKYVRNKKSPQFEKNLEMVYNKCKQLGIGKIYLIERNDIRHLQTFERWLRDLPSQKSIKNQNEAQSEAKNQYFYFSPDFPKSPFKVQEKQIAEQVSQIRKYKIQINPIDLNEEIFESFKNIFNRTTVIKQCPEFVPSSSENKCIDEYRKHITTLIQQGMLKNKSDEYRFFALTPKSKKDTSPILNFHKILKQTQQKQLNQTQKSSKNQQSHKNQNTFVLKNDLIGKQIQNLRDFKARNYSILRNLTSYERFLLFIRPRVFIVSKSNPSVDLYWYVTCLHRNKKASISINNTDSFNLGKRFSITDGFSYPLNTDLQFLKELYKNHPQLNYIIVNTEIVSQLIRHLPVKRKYSIYDLTSDLQYPKMFLPDYDNKLSPSENYNILFKSQIQRFLTNPKFYDIIVLDKQKKVNSKQLTQLMKQSNQKFVLRVCNLNCSEELSDQKLYKALQKITKIQSSEQISNENNQIGQKKIQKNWKNKIFENTYWIDSAFNNVGLKEGDYVFSSGNYENL